jgi:hypothetical protein
MSTLNQTGHSSAQRGCQNAPCPVQSEVKHWNGANHSSTFTSARRAVCGSSQRSAAGQPIFFV